MIDRSDLEERPGIVMVLAGVVFMAAAGLFVEDNFLRVLLVVPGMLLLYLGSHSLLGPWRNGGDAGPPH